MQRRLITIVAVLLFATSCYTPHDVDKIGVVVGSEIEPVRHNTVKIIEVKTETDTAEFVVSVQSEVARGTDIYLATINNGCAPPVDVLCTEKPQDQPPFENCSAIN